MKKFIFRDKPFSFVRKEEATPVCGKDFCDTCGDCLYCYVGDPCYDGSEEKGAHYWVSYIDLEEKRRCKKW